MPATIQSLGIDRLTVEERLSLVQDIWDTIVAESPDALPLSEEQCCELDRRLEAHEANPDDVVAWEVVREKALKRLQS